MKYWMVVDDEIIIGEDRRHAMHGSSDGWYITQPLKGGVCSLYEYCDGTEPRYFGEYDTLEEALAAAKIIP